MFHVPNECRVISGKFATTDADRNNGVFIIPLKNDYSIQCIASDGEEWLPIEGYEGLYEVSNLGKVRTLPKDVSMPNNASRHLDLSEVSYEKTRYGYLRVSLCKNRIINKQLLHILVAKAFIPNPFNYTVINHIDGNKKNSFVLNLEWCTTKYNINHAIENGLSIGFKKEEILYIKSLLEEGKSVIEIAKMYDRSRQTISDIKFGRYRDFKNEEPSRYVGINIFWEHVSVTVKFDNKTAIPQWNVMCLVKDIFWDPEDCVVQYHPPKSEYVNCHEHVLHLWRPQGYNMMRPPSILVGGK